MRDQSIKHYVIRRLLEGESLGLIWEEVRDRYRHRCAGWGYMLTIRKNFLRTTDLTNPPEKKP